MCAGISLEEYEILSGCSQNIMFFYSTCRPKVNMALKFFNEIQEKQKSIDGKLQQIEDRLANFDQCKPQNISIGNEVSNKLLVLQPNNQDQPIEVITSSFMELRSVQLTLFVWRDPNVKWKRSSLSLLALSSLSVALQSVTFTV